MNILGKQHWAFVSYDAFSSMHAPMQRSSIITAGIKSNMQSQAEPGKTAVMMPPNTLNKQLGWLQFLGFLFVIWGFFTRGVFPGPKLGVELITPYNFHRLPILRTLMSDKEIWGIWALHRSYFLKSVSNINHSHLNSFK